jgi:glyoxylase-like metal-dependent hydrolase (beta-lactamase superfamily II)
VDVSVVEVASGVWQARAAHVCWVLIVDRDGTTLVDTGYPGDKERVIASLGKIGRAPADVDAVVLTHAHPDHLGSAEYFRSQVGKPVRVHQQEKANATGEHVEQVSVPTLLKRARRPSVLVWFVQAGIGLKAAQVQRLGTVETFSGGSLDVPGRPLAIHTPGHTSGHAVLHLPDQGVLVAGDALMTEHALATSSGPQMLPDFFNTNTSQARASLELLRPLNADVVLPGHGPAFHGTPNQAVDLALQHP